MGLEELEDHLVSSELRWDDVAAIREAAAELRAGAPGTEPKTPQCLDEFAIGEFVDGAGAGAGAVDSYRRAELLAHLASCGGCRSEVLALSRLIAKSAIDSDLEPAAGAAPHTNRRRRFAMAGGVIGTAAAAAAVAFLLIPRWLQDEDAHRAPVLTLSAPPVAVAPAGSVVAPIQFVWTSVPRADRYLLTLFDETGSILWELQTTDSGAAVPDSIDLVPETSYFWKAEAQIGFDRWSESELVRFTLTTPPDSTAR